jgi:hypothetical protein
MTGVRDRHQLEIVLERRFPGSSHEQVAAAANAIMTLVDHWNLPDDRGHRRSRRDDETGSRTDEIVSPS